MRRISIIVPAYNIENYIKQCVDSLINQTYPNIEIIIVDDGSKDNTGYICDNYLSDTRVKVIHTANKGIASARNTGISISTGEYIMFVDGDDWIGTDTCEKAVKAAEDNGSDLVMWSYTREYGNVSYRKNIYEEMMFFNNNDINKLFKRIIGLENEELRKPENADALSTAWCKLYKKEIILNNKIAFISTKEVGPTEDLLFNVNIMPYIKRAVFINEWLYHYRKTNNASLTASYRANMFTQLLESFGYIESLLKNFNLYEEYSQALNNRICFSIIGIGLNELNSNNDKKFIQRIKYLNNVLSSEKYETAFEKFQLISLPLKWKAFFLCAKYRALPLLYVQLIFMNFMRKQF